jgi:nucleoside 2-deoxyribosyltransferase
MKVYLAAQYYRRDAMRGFAYMLKDIGIEVTSSWLRERADVNSDLSDNSHEFLRRHARNDIADIEAADVLILFTVDPILPTKRGGRHVELGYALALGKKIIICGPRENIFHHLPEVMQFNVFGDILFYLEKLNA